jgi:phosphoribosyl-ATP pyrophosphohydrolase
MSKSKGKKENYEHYKKILYKIFEEAKEIYGKKDNSIFKELTEEIAVLITSLLKKVVSPNQDIRLNRKEFEGGYSGRSLDTHAITPWLKHHFPRFAPKESGWLTRSIEQPHPFNKEFPGKIRNKKVKEAFLSILDSIESESKKEYGAKKQEFIY